MYDCTKELHKYIHSHKNVLYEDPFYSTKILILFFDLAGLAVFPQIKHDIMKVVQS